MKVRIETPENGLTHGTKVFIDDKEIEKLTGIVVELGLDDITRVTLSVVGAEVEFKGGVNVDGLKVIQQQHDIKPRGIITSPAELPAWKRIQNKYWAKLNDGGANQPQQTVIDYYPGDKVIFSTDHSLTPAQRQVLNQQWQEFVNSDKPALVLEAGLKVQVIRVRAAK